ncbi:MAG TPA: 3-deoxy-8-phosphooctulonate synthase [Saprospiraceae bacterium]|jgi:2-dehydro-3-deoxyphosphooctonate aldolase (KDO 8-P synthase)|nr:3-deoxy-8-phosphooctulonate synthase [Saprospiraceae bacterium]
MKFQQLKNIHHQDSKQFFLISGPCVVESEQMCMDIAGKVLEICDEYKIPYIFKASYRKANRTRVDSYTGIGDQLGLDILKKISTHYNIPVTTDIHTEEEALLAAQFVDILQIPAFLCRQTTLLVAAASTQKVVNVKKGQFASPEAMKHAVDKIKSTGNDHTWLTDRGTCFGYQDLIVDYRAIPAMQAFHVPVIMDCTHSLQQPNQSSGVTGGRPDLIPTIASAAIAVGADGLFIETHPDPKNAKSDGANMLPLDKLKSLIERLVKIREAII